MLDKSKGLVLGANIATVSSVAGVAIGGPAFTNYTISPAMVAGRTYEISFTVSGYSGSGAVGLAGNASNFEPDVPLASSGISGNGTVRVIGISSNSISAVALYTQSTNTANFSNISVKELPGNHAVQATTANRPIYGIHPVGGRRNLLVRTEEFENASWSLDNSGTVSPVVTANAAIAPDGTLTADRIILNKSGGLFSRIQQTSNLTPLPSAIYTFSVWMRKNGSGTANVGIRISDVGVNCVVTDTWQRFSVSLATAGTNAFSQILLFDSIIGNDETADIFAWGAQTETGSTATAYQRVTDQYNVTEAGVSSVSYLFFDGVNDSLATPSINFPAGPTNPTLGAELVVNGDFSSATGWTAQSGWTIGSGVLTGNVASAAFASTFRSVSLTAGRTYSVTFTITGYTSGEVRANLGGTTEVFGSARTSTGTFTQLLTAVAGSNSIAIQAGNPGFVGTIDNISVREIDAAQAPDKMTVFAGVRKLSDAAQGMFAELSAAVVSNAGAFAMIAPSSASSNYMWRSKGSASQVDASYTNAAVAAPVTNVLTGIGDISGDVTRLRINSTQVAEALTDQGTGTYGNYPLFIGARNSASLFFSGHLYSLIVRGAQSNTGQISSTETWVAGKTGITI
jgi:hypothetical protein